jgi:hypothetical protein
MDITAGTDEPAGIPAKIPWGRRAFALRDGDRAQAIAIEYRRRWLLARRGARLGRPRV